MVEVHAAGVSFPEVLQTRGEYQLKPPLPFVPGSEVAGVVREAPADAAVGAGRSRGRLLRARRIRETAVAPEFLTFPLSPELDFAQGAGLILNYHTAYFALALRGRLTEGETVLVHGAAGGVGTAALQVARGLGARTIAVVSSEEKQRIAEQAGAETVLRSDGPWKDEAKESRAAAWTSCSTRSAAIASPTACARCARTGRVVVVGFTGGSIPEVRVNRLLLGNTEVIGAGWGAYAMARPELCREIGGALDPMIEAGLLAPIVGARFPLERAARGAARDRRASRHRQGRARRAWLSGPEALSR